MSKSLFILSLCLLLVSRALPAFADGYDDCLDGCRNTVAPCVEQVRLTAGNIQEEENLIAACERNKDACIQACRDAEANPSPPPASQDSHHRSNHHRNNHHRNNHHRNNRHRNNRHRSNRHRNSHATGTTG